MFKQVSECACIELRVYSSYVRAYAESAEMTSAGIPLSKWRHSDSSSCSSLSETARRLLVAKCAREGTLVTHSSSWRPEIQSIHETVAARYSGLRLEESKEQQWIVVSR